MPKITLQEFIQWFDGYTEAVVNRPTFDQWQVIKDKIASLSVDNGLFTDHRGISKRHTNVQPLKVSHD